MKKNILFICLFAFASIFANEAQSDVSGKPRVVTTTTVKITNSSGESIEKQIATSKLLTVQRTDTTVIKSDGTVFNATTIGRVVGDVTHSRKAVNRVELANEILQGDTITIDGNNIIVNGEIAKDLNGNNYDATSIIGSVYTVYVHAVNGQATTITYNETDQVGSSNVVTYWINGKDTGISANLGITRTLVTATTTKTGTSIAKKQLFTQDSYPLTVTISGDVSADSDFLNEYLGTYTLKTSGNDTGYYVNQNETVRFAAAVSSSSSVDAEYSGKPYATEFETKNGDNFLKRNDFIVFSSNSFNSYMYPVTKGSAQASVHPTITVSGSVNTNIGQYYFIDNVFTNIVAEEGDRITETYTPIDPASKNEEIASSYKLMNVRRNGEIIVSGVNIETKEIKSLTKSGKTITGVFSYGDVIIATSGSKKAYGRTVVLKDGYIYFDGVNSGILDSDATYSTKSCYFVDGKPTDVEYSESDEVTSKVYYVEDGALTAYEKLETDTLETEDIPINENNSLQEKTIEVTANGTSYKATNATRRTGAYRLNTSKYGSLYCSTKSTYTDDVIKLNGADIGRRSGAYFFNARVQSGETSENVSDHLFSVKGTSYTDLGAISVPYYIPQYDGYYFINGGRPYNFDGSSATVTGPSGYTFYQTEGSFFCGLYNGQFFLGRISSYNSGSSFASNQGTFSGLWRTVTYHSSVLERTKLFLTYASLGNGITRCISCFNDETNSFISMAGTQSWGNYSYGVHTSSRKIYYGNGHITTLLTWGGINNYDFQKVCLLEGTNLYSKYLALDKNGKVWLIDHKKCFAKMLLIDGAVMTDIDANRSGRGVAISSDKMAVYVINPDMSIIKYPLQSAPIDVVYGRSTIGVRTADNRLYTMDCPTGSTVTPDSLVLSPIVNVTEIGISANKVICTGAGVVENVTYTNVPMVRVNGKEYQQSSLTFESNVELYTLDGTKTMYRVSPEDTTTSIPYIRLTLENNQGTIGLAEDSISSVNARVVSRAADGGILGILTTENGMYYLNGNNLNIQANVLDEIEMNSRKTYYIGNVNTGIEPEGEDDKVEIKGDYWEVNGRNTAVRYYGLGEMCVRVSDVTPGELTEDDTATASTVVVPLVVRAQIVRFNPDRPITSIKLQYRKLTDSNWTNLKELTNAKRKLETKGLQAIFGRYVEVPVSKSESFLVRVNISDGTESTVTASALEPEQGNVFYYSFIRSQKERVK